MTTLEFDESNQNMEVGQFEDIFNERLRKYDEGRKIVKEEKEAQIELVSQLRAAHAAFTQAKREDICHRKREEILQSLETGYAKYNEIISNLDVGRRFYKDLAKIVVRFRDECSAFSRERSAELKQLER